MAFALTLSKAVQKLPIPTEDHVAFLSLVEMTLREADSKHHLNIAEDVVIERVMQMWDEISEVKKNHFVDLNWSERRNAKFLPKNEKLSDLRERKAFVLFCENYYEEYKKEYRNQYHTMKALYCSWMKLSATKKSAYLRAVYQGTEKVDLPKKPALSRSSIRTIQSKGMCQKRRRPTKNANEDNKKPICKLPQSIIVPTRSRHSLSEYSCGDQSLDL